ncbi:MAG: carboxypeptidase-like regulatory domain-containing protein, partial [archaeon]
MGLSESLGKLYMRVEDAYYGALDFFEDKGIGLPWSYNDFLERKGVPALPFTFAILFLLTAGIFITATTNQPQSVEFSLSLKDDKGRSLDDVGVEIFDEEGNLLLELTASDGQTIQLEGIRPDALLKITANKSGYGEKTGLLNAGEKGIKISLKGDNDAIVGKLKLIDAETGTTITDATVDAEWAGGNGLIVAYPQEDGIVLLNVPLNAEVVITVKAPNYEDLHDALVFTSGDVKIKEMAPKSGASEGPSIVFIKAIDGKTQLPLEDVHITIEHAQSNHVITDIDAPTGMHSETLTKGTPIRVTVKKDGFLTYTSQTQYPGGKTLREEQESIIAPLLDGGTNLLVRTRNATNQQPIDGARVDLLDASYGIIDSQTGNFSGEASFGGLNQGNAYYVVGFHPNFLPTRIPVAWEGAESTDNGKAIDLGLTPFTSGSAGILTVFVNEPQGGPASGAVLGVEELVDGAFLPLIAPRSVDAAGSFTARLPVGTIIRVNAQQGERSAEKELTIAAGLNKVVLSLSSGLHAVDLQFTFSNGQAFSGDIKITDTGGGDLFEDTITGGTVFLLTNSSEDTVHITATDTSGKTYTQTIAIAGRNTIPIILDAAPGSEGASPRVEYLGLFDASGEPVPGVSPEHDVFARFRIQWPASAEKGGLFVRVGPDSIRNVDSQFIGIMGVNGEADTILYGKTWTPNPIPGNESKDRKSGGKAGTLSKWVEVVEKNPNGSSVIDVRLSARPGTATGTNEIHYRAFAEINHGIARTPADTELGTNPYTNQKSGLYAATQGGIIPTYAEQPLCQNGICLLLSFVDGDSRSYPIGGFQAVEGKPYAVHVEVLPSLSEGSETSTPTTGASTTNTLIAPLKTGITIKAQTGGEALLVFTKTEIGTFGPLSDNGNKDTSISATLSSIDPSTGGRARIHFTTQERGDAVLTLTVSANNTQWTQTIPISIVEARLLRVGMPDRVNPNEGFSISIRDEEGNPIPDALIRFHTLDGKFAASVQGKDTPGKGANGNYSIDQALDPGLYNVKVKVPGYVDYEDTLHVGVNNPLTMEEKVTIDIPYGDESSTTNVSVTNTTSSPIANVTAEFQPYESFPGEITLEFGTIPTIPAKGKGLLPLTARYNGSPTDVSILSGGGLLTVRGEINSLFPVSDTATLSATYNRGIDPSCLTFDKTKVSITLMGETQPYGNLYGEGSTAQGNVPYYGESYSPNPYSYGGTGYNAYGYDDTGNYQNAESKRVSVKATNHCGVELLLIPGVSTVDGQLEVDGLKVAAVDSQLKLVDGEQKQVDFTLTNQLFRAGLVPQLNQYALTFQSPQLSARIPLDIQFYDRSRALQTPAGVELDLIHAGKDKATDRAVVPITNVGGSPIYDLRATLEGETPEGVKLTLENHHPYAQTVNSINTAYSGGSYQGGYFDPNQSLPPGQTQYPPIAIVGESVSEEEGVQTMELEITGNVEGKRILLKTIPVYIRTGSTSCLIIQSFDTPISFISSEVSGTLSKRITITNQCNEPVRITQVNPSTINGNGLSIHPVAGSDTLEKEEEAEYNLSFTKGNPYKANLAFTIQGVMILTQKEVESNPLPLEIALGENELTRANATNPISVPICEGGTMQVRFPLLAQKDECSQAYCDAEQAGNMLASLIEQSIAKAVKGMQSKNNDATQFQNCDLTKGYCTFSQLGIASTSIDLYLQNDILTTEILEYVMRDGTYPRLSRMQSQVMTELSGENADVAFAQRLGTGLGNMVFIPDIQGCGKYSLSILGSVENVANQLEPDAITIAIKQTATHPPTAECEDKIYNAANFLPKDRSLTALNSQQTLLGLVKYSPELEQPARSLAKTIFGNEDRAIQQTGSNRMTLQKGVLSGAIVELSLDPLTYGEGPKNIITTIQEVGGTIPDEAAIEAGKIITALGSSAKVVNGCITQDERTWRISSIPNIGKLSYEGCALPGTNEGGLAIRPNLTCCTLTTQSPIASEVSYTLDPSGNDPIPGIVQMDLYEKKDTGTPSTKATPGNPLSYGSPYALPFDTKKQVYEKEIVLCATSDPHTQQQAHREKVQTSATRTLDGVKAGPLTLELRTCSLDADDALAKAYAKGNGVWYATVDWEEDVSSKTLKQVLAEIVDGKKTPEAFFSYQDQGILASDNPVYQDKFKSQQAKALGSFALSCALACGACHVGTAVLTLGTTFAAGAVDCAISCGAGTAMGGYE